MIQGQSEASMTNFTVTFRKKSSYQKDDCISCNKRSTLEAVIPKGLPEGLTVNVRCCTELRCKRRAARLAREGAKAFTQAV